MPITSNDVHRAFDIYRRSAAALRGKTTRKKIGPAEVDDALKEQRTDQVLYTDVMKVREQAYLEPLQLVVTSNIDRENTENIGQAVQAQVNLQRAIAWIQPCTYPHGPAAGTVRTRWSVPRGGDHLDKFDVKIRRMKETIRSVSAGLPWTLPISRVKDIVTYPRNIVHQNEREAHQLEHHSSRSDTRHRA